MNKNLIILLITIIVTESAAQWCIQKKLSDKEDIFLIFGVLLYGIVGVIYYHILKHGKKLAIANTLWNAGTEITITIIGFLFFKQKLSYKQLIGIGLILISMYIV